MNIYNPLKLNEDAINYLNEATTWSEIESIIKALPTRDQMASLLNSTKCFERNLP